MTPNIYQQLGLKKVINACGKMTILGVSSVAPEVMQATARAASAFVEIDALVEKKPANWYRAIRVLKIAISPRAPRRVLPLPSLPLSPTAIGRASP